MRNEMESRGGLGRRKYPIGLQSFREIQEGEYLYIDKTEVVYQLVETGKYYFLSRPRRFGKSLLLDTIEELFTGSHELFERLWIHGQWNWERTNPVIHFNFAGMGVTELGLRPAIFKALHENAQRLGVTLTDTSIDQQFKELIIKASAKGNVVILIDEYDKPLIDYLDNPAKLDEHRGIMKSFYSILKGSDGQIRLLFITGVSRFGRVSIFSDLNNLRDITLNAQFSTLTGITQAELERDFAGEIEEMEKESPDILHQIKEWYNGYSWRGKHRLYNPFSLLNFMADRVFDNYWYTTGTPTFLFEQLKKRKLGDMDGVEVTANTLADFNTDNLDAASLLFQTGYLTIKNISGQIYELGYPNREVKESLLDGLLNAYREPVVANSLVLVTILRKALATGDVEKVIDLLDSLLGQIPYEHWRADTESIFTVVAVLTFKLAGVEIHTEVHSNKGRCDVLVATQDYIYVMELKLDRPAKEALEQILAKNYLQPYQADPRKKIALGIGFSSAERKVAEFEILYIK